MRLLVLAVMLALLAPAVSAQMPSGSLSMYLDFPSDAFEGGDSFNGTVAVVYDCPLVSVDVMGASVVELSARGPSSVSITGPLTQIIPEGTCIQGGAYAVEFPMQVFLADHANGTLMLDFVADMYTSNQQLNPSPDEVRATYGFQATSTTEPATEPEEEADVPLEEEAPGPALPLLAAGLLALARRRQA